MCVPVRAWVHINAMTTNSCSLSTIFSSSFFWEKFLLPLYILPFMGNAKLKVIHHKYYKHFSWNVSKSHESIFCWNSKYLTKFWPMKLGQNFVKYFVCFLGNGVSRKNDFEIYWLLFWPKKVHFRPYHAWTYLQLRLRQWGAGNIYLLLLSRWKVNIAVMGL